MKVSSLILMLTLVTTILAGCANSIYFYETEKVAVNIEGRPDPTAPLSGNVGVKQRVVSIVPSKKIDENGYPVDDAVSLISYFNFDKDPKKVVIQTVLITGQPDYFGADPPPDRPSHPLMQEPRANAPALFRTVAGLPYSRSSKADCIEAWLELGDEEEPNPRLEAMVEFLRRNNIGVRPTSWLNTSDESGREAQYDDFIEEQGIDCD